MPAASAPVQIEPQAPVAARGESMVAAAPATLWLTMSDIDRWPSWSRDITAATLEGALAPGTSFKWSAGPGTIRSTLIAVEPERLLAWTGSTMGIRAVHVWRIEQRGGDTWLITEESWDGILASVLRGPMRRRLQASIDEGMSYLKDEAERRQALPEVAK